MDVDASLRETARALERRVSAALGEVPAAGAADERTAALVHVIHYVDLLREAASGMATRYLFKLEFVDGRWDVAEKQLPGVPRVGDLVQFEDGCPWRIFRTQLVRPRPAGKPPVEFFVCAPEA